MPGAFVNVAATVGLRVSGSSTLLALEMETHVTPYCDAEVEAVRINRSLVTFVSRLYPLC